MRIGALVAAGLFAGAVLAVGMLILRRSSGDISASTRSERDHAALRARVKALEGALAAARRSARATPTSPPAVPSRQPDHVEGGPDEQGSETGGRSERRIAYIQEVFEADPVDRAWAPHAEAQILEAVGSAGLEGSSLRRLDCRMRLCRAEVEHATDPDFEIFASELPTRLEGMPRTTMKRLPSGGGRERTIVYMAREGYRMPVPP